MESKSVFPVILRLPDLYMLRGKRWMASSWTCLGSYMMGTSSTSVSVNVLTIVYNFGDGSTFDG